MQTVALSSYSYRSVTIMPFSDVLSILPFFQEDQLGLSLLTLEQVQSEEFQKKIQQAAMEVS